MGNCLPCCWLSSTIPFRAKPVPERFRYPIITLDGNLTYVEPARCTLSYTPYQSIEAPPSFTL